MTNQTQLLEEASRRAYYDTNSESVELGYRRFKQWKVQTVMFLMAVAVFLWMFSYALFMVIMYHYDKGIQALYVFDLFYWMNQTCTDDQEFDSFALFY